MTTSVSQPMPVFSLLALALAGFITILTEALPAGLLAQIAHGLAASEAWIGQTVTVYAVGSLVAAIPLPAATKNLRRRPLLLTALAGFVIANTFTTVSTSSTPRAWCQNSKKVGRLLSPWWELRWHYLWGFLLALSSANC